MINPKRNHWQGAPAGSGIAGSGSRQDLVAKRARYGTRTGAVRALTVGGLPVRLCSTPIRTQ